jgi:phosphate-selective porin OprO and OprP
MKTLQIFLVIGLFFSALSFSQNQDGVKQTPYFSFKNGLGFATPDSSWSINVRFRVQNRFLMNTTSDEDFSPKGWEARVRRCRLSFTGHLYNPKWTYYLQLSFSKGDMDWSMTETSAINNSPNVVRDAMIFYRPTKHWQFALGQGKLPGNRQRVVSSGALQFYDRSPANANFTFDRDFGFFSTYNNKFGNQFVWLFKTAVTSGEGRNSAASNSGLAYTGRLELLPAGNFTEGGDYFEGDVIREEKVKISIAGSYCFNDMSVRSQGQLGKDLYQAKCTHGYEADLLIKYRGFALSAEYLRRDTDNPITKSGTNSVYVITGDGVNTQISYCFPSRIELAARHTLVSPHNDLYGKMNQQEQFGLGLTKYLMKHKFKIQGNVFYNRERDLLLSTEKNKYFFAAFQIEAGI